MDCSLPASSIHGIFQARVLEWGAIAFSTCPSNAPLTCSSSPRPHTCFGILFGHLMQRTDSLENALMLGKIEGGWRRGQQRMRWLDGMDSLLKLNECEFEQTARGRRTGKPDKLQSMNLFGVAKSQTQLSD